jgi:hypothetical protein
MAFYGVHKKARTSPPPTTTPNHQQPSSHKARPVAGTSSYYESKDHLAMAMLTAEEQELLERGLQWVGFKQKKRTPKVLVRRFKSMFGEGPVAINK